MTIQLNESAKDFDKLSHDIDKALSVVFDEENQDEEFQNGIARDLNRLVCHAQNEFAASKGSELALATLRIIERVSEFEQVKMITATPYWNKN